MDVFLIFGTSFPTDGPGLSALIRWIFCPPTNGMTASTKTNTPIPPTQCVKLRQNRLHRANASTSVKILDPVVVNPETVSNIASTTDGISPLITNGMAPKKLITIQLIATVKNPSFA